MKRFLLILIVFAPSAFAQAPTITSVNPNIGAVGTGTWIAGTNIGTAVSGTVTSSGTTNATVTWVSGTQFTAGMVNSSIKINGTNINVSAVGSATSLTVACSASGPLCPTTGTLSYSMSIQGTTTITVNGTSVTTAVGWTPSGVLIQIPSTTTGPVVVTTAGGTSNSVTFTVSSALQAPILPQATVSLTLPTQGATNCATLTTGSNCKRFPITAANLTSALNAATCGDTIILVHGTTYSGNFVVPSTACSGWIEIQSDALASLPSPGSRVDPSMVANMATISTANTAPAFTFAPGANHWRLMGLNVTDSVSGSTEVFNLICMGFDTSCGVETSTIAQLPDQIIIDRCYLYGTSDGITTKVTRGIFANTQAFAMVDSYCDGIVDNGFDAQCVASNGNSTGPFLFQNNFLQAAGENIIFGGSDPIIANIIPSDITVVGNLFSKLTAWFNAPGTYDVKNLFELKNAQRVLLDGNVFQYDSNGPQHAAVLFRSVNQSLGCDWCSTLDVTFTHNIIQHAPMAFSIIPIEAASNPSVPTGKVLVQNNLILDVQCAYGSGYGTLAQLGVGEPNPFLLHDINYDHNTGFGDPSVCSISGMLYVAGTGGSITNLQITNNISNFGSLGASGDSCGSNWDFCITLYLPTLTWNKNVFTTTTQTHYTTAPTLWAGSVAGVGFTSTSGTNPNLTGNFQLTGVSTYHNAGTDAKDIGVSDWPCLNQTTNAAVAGNYNQVVVTGGCFLGSNNAVTGNSTTVLGSTLSNGATIQ